MDEEQWRKQREVQQREELRVKHLLEEIQQRLEAGRKAIEHPRTTADDIADRDRTNRANRESLERQISQEQKKKDQEQADKELERQVLKKFLRPRPDETHTDVKKQRPDKNRTRDRQIKEGGWDLTPEEFGEHANRLDIQPLKSRQGEPPWPGWKIAVTRSPFNRKIAQLRYRVKRKYKPKSP